VVVWIVSLLGSLPVVLQYGVVYLYNGERPIAESATCALNYEGQTGEEELSPLRHTFTVIVHASNRKYGETLGEGGKKNLAHSGIRSR